MFHICALNDNSTYTVKPKNARSPNELLKCISEPFTVTKHDIM